jgi:hypothetical protein
MAHPTAAHVRGAHAARLCHKVTCSHREPAYQAPGSWKCWNAACEIKAGRCPFLAESERTREHAIILPLFRQMTDEQQKVVRVLGEAIAAAGTRSELPPTERVPRSVVDTCPQVKIRWFTRVRRLRVRASRGTAPQ